MFGTVLLQQPQSCDWWMLDVEMLCSGWKYSLIQRRSLQKCIEFLSVWDPLSCLTLVVSEHLFYLRSSLIFDHTPIDDENDLPSARRMKNALRQPSWYRNVPTKIVKPHHQGCLYLYHYLPCCLLVLQEEEQVLLVILCWLQIDWCKKVCKWLAYGSNDLLWHRGWLFCVTW